MWETLQRWAWPRSFYHENAAGRNFWSRRSRIAMFVRVYARITDCRLARLFPLETHEVYRAFAFTHKSGFPGAVCPLRRRTAGTGGGVWGSSLFDFHEFLMYRHGIRSKKWFQENALRYYAKRREEISLGWFSVDKRFSLQASKTESQASLFFSPPSLSSFFLFSMI